MTPEEDTIRRLSIQSVLLNIVSEKGMSGGLKSVNLDAQSGDIVSVEIQGAGTGGPPVNCTTCGRSPLCGAHESCHRASYWIPKKDGVPRNCHTCGNRTNCVGDELPAVCHDGSHWVEEK